MWLNISAASIGSALEWYDVLIYAFLAPEIGRAFFPNQLPLVATAAALASFGLSYVVRPLGGLVLGRYADRAGRRAGLVLVSTLMFLATAIITFLPAYATIGVTGPILLFAARLVQGFSAGGEFGSGVAYLAEQNPDHRGFLTSWQFASQGAAIILAAAVTGTVAAFLPGDAMAAWGWRIPFGLGLIIGPVAYFIRTHVTETPEFELSRNDRSGHPLHWGRIALGTVTAALASASIYTMIYLPTLGTGSLGLSKFAAQGCSVLGGMIMLVMTPVFGWLTDRLGHDRWAIWSAGLVAVLAIPLFRLLDIAPGFASLMITQAGLSLITAAYLAALSPFLAALFPTATRTFSIACSYNIAVLLAGGFAPLGFALLASHSAHYFVFGAYPATIAVLTCVCLLIHRRANAV